MNTARQTWLLTGLGAAAVLAAALSLFWMNAGRDAADDAAQRLAGAHGDLNLIAKARRSPGRSVAPALDTSALTAQAREAAKAVGLPNPPGGLEPFTPARIGDSDYSETLVSMRLDAATLRQVVQFLLRLSEADPSARVRQIDLSPSEDRTNPEAWTADIGMAHLTYTPRRNAP